MLRCFTHADLVLQFAAAKGHVDLCAALIKSGADKTSLAYEGPSKDALSVYLSLLPISGAYLTVVNEDRRSRYLRSWPKNYRQNVRYKCYASFPTVWNFRTRAATDGQSSRGSTTHIIRRRLQYLNAASFGFCGLHRWRKSSLAALSQYGAASNTPYAHSWCMKGIIRFCKSC